PAVPICATVTNTGGFPASINAAPTIAPPFAVVNAACPAGAPALCVVNAAINPGGSCSIAVGFTPPVGGKVPTTPLTVNYFNGVANVMATGPVDGAGIEAPASAPQPVVFGSKLLVGFRGTDGTPWVNTYTKAGAVVTFSGQQNIGTIGII